MKPCSFPLPLVIRTPNWLGDAILSLPALWNLKAFLGDQPLWIASPEPLAALWDACEFVNGVVRLQRPKDVWATARQLRSYRFAATILFTQSERCLLQARLAGIPWIYGRARRWNRWFYSTSFPLPPQPKRRHLAWEYIELLRPFGIPQDLSLPRLRLPPLFPRDRSKRRIALCPGAEYGPAKRWPARSFAAVGNALLQSLPCTLWILGSPRDAPVCDEVARLCPGAHNLGGQTSLGEFLNYLASCDLVISNDSGAMHAASALQVPTIAIFGSTDPQKSGPLGSQTWILQEKIPCSPCFRRECPIGLRCMEAIPPQRVIELALPLLA
ncbi:lipopolysaccharide heptosyltransferase II [Candidatus Methylacidithermus pantelleriae]|nr:lipopolysaccharide heptosyltransferase II [Candidatus Methylacidithermus pantelleriae]